jgi:sialic acid synthase SpsE
MNKSLSNSTGPYVIAEVGSNWKVSDDMRVNLEMARRHIYDAAKCGAQAVKFQMYQDFELYGMSGMNRWELPQAWLPELASYASQNSIEFMCTAFSPNGYLVVDPFVNIHKVASCEMKHEGILSAVLSTKKPFLVSNGASHELEIKAVVENIIRRDKSADFGFLECAAAYPASELDYRPHLLRTMIPWPTEQRDSNEVGLFDFDPVLPYVGISDHTETDLVALCSMGFGAKVFEKHFRSYDYPANTPDAKHSIGVRELASYIRNLTTAAIMLYDNSPKCARQSEQDIVSRGKRRLKVIRDIKKGESLKIDHNFGVYRSIIVDLEARGPEMASHFDGAIALRDLRPGDPVWEKTAQANA